MTTDPLSETDSAEPEELRAQIRQTRAELGDTVEALAAKMDVKARAKDAVGDAAGRAKDRAVDAADKAKDKVIDAADKARDVVSGVGGKIRSGAVSVRDSAYDADLPTVARNPLPWGTIGALAAAAGIVIYLVRRRRS